MNRLKTNTKEVRNKIKEHILSCVYDENENTFNSIEEASTYLFNEFKRVNIYPNNLKILGSYQNCFKDYLGKLPFNFLYSYYDIQSFLIEITKDTTGKEYCPSKSYDLYTYLIYSEMMKNKEV